MKRLFYLVAAVFAIACTKTTTINNNTIPPSKPTLTTNAITNITNSTARSGGAISSDGTASITAKGVCWSTNHNPTISDAKTTDGTGVDDFNSNLIGLTQNTTYYARAYATNSVGTGYGNEISFTTTIDSTLYLPTVIINNVYSITETSATASGNVTNQGGSSVTERGFQFSTMSNLASGTGIIVGFGSGGFYKAINNLMPNTTYYIRAYAINSYGIAYSNIISFTTLSTPTTVTDIDGNIYHTVTIGSQVWMVENLKVTRYRDGTAIPNITDGFQWSDLTTGAYCYYNNDASYNNTLGKLYNWHVVNNPKKIAPIGWHVPTNLEIQTLANYLGGVWNSSGNNYTIVGGKMKSTSSLWNSPNTGATNSSGFTGLPSNIRNGDGGGSFNPTGYYGQFWSSTNYNANYAYFFGLSYGSDVLSLFYWYKPTGFAIRCIKD